MSQCNKYGETPLDKCKPYLAEILRGEPIYKKEEAFFSCNSVNLKTRGQKNDHHLELLIINNTAVFISTAVFYCHFY